MSFESSRVFYKPGKSNPKFGDRRKVDKYEGPIKDTLIESDDFWEDCPYVDYNNIPSQCSGYRESMNHRIRVYDDRRYKRTNYALFVRFMNGNVGRKWVDVHHELVELYDRRSHERSAINRMITRDVCVNVGYDENETGGLVSLSSDKRRSLDWFNYYVDPVTGALCRAPYVSYKTVNKQRNAEYQANQKESLIKIDKVTEHHKIDGAWYEIKFTLYEPVITRFYAPFYTNRSGRSFYREQVRYQYPLVYDVLKKCSVTEKRVATNRRTLSHKELKQFKLV